MNTDSGANGQKTDGQAQASAPLGQPLPALATDLSISEIRRRLEQGARRGRVPGYQLPRNGADTRNGGPAFEIIDIGVPFGSVLEARLEEVPATPAGQSGAAIQGSEGRAGSVTLRFAIRLKKVAPAVFLTVLILTVWPGVTITDSMLKTYFSWYTIPTWLWYLPLTVPFVPLAHLSAVRKSRAAAHAEAHAIIPKISEELERPS